jgi:hypothetical protein
MATTATNVPATDSLNRLEVISIISTAALAVVLVIVALISVHYHSILTLALSVGGLGGLTHEIAQSRGKILFFQRAQDGIYLGSIAGIVLGAVAGILVVRGYLTGGGPAPNFTQESYEIFTAGLALKGVVEAAGGNAVPQK